MNAAADLGKRRESEQIGEVARLAGNELVERARLAGRVGQEGVKEEPELGAVARGPAPAAEDLEGVYVLTEQTQEKELPLVVAGGGGLRDERRRGGVVDLPRVLDAVVEKLRLARVVDAGRRPFGAAPGAKTGQHRALLPRVLVRSVRPHVVRASVVEWIHQLPSVNYAPASTARGSGQRRDVRRARPRPRRGRRSPPGDAPPQADSRASSRRPTGCAPGGYEPRVTGSCQAVACCDLHRIEQKVITGRTPPTQHCRLQTATSKDLIGSIIRT